MGQGGEDLFVESFYGADREVGWGWTSNLNEDAEQWAEDQFNSTINIPAGYRPWWAKVAWSALTGKKENREFNFAFSIAGKSQGIEHTVVTYDGVVLNLDAEFEYEAGDPTGYRAGEAKPGGQSLGKAAGGDGLNVRLYELPPGQSLCPYHYEYAEEWLLVLDGAPTLRVPNGEQPLQRGELVCFPPGPDGAHKVTNDTEQTARVRGRQLELGDQIFTNDPDARRPWRPELVTRRWERLRATSGPSHMRIHDLRHFVATELLTAGIDVRTVANRLGHARTSTTLDIYWAWVPARDRDAAHHIEAILR